MRPKEKTRPKEKMRPKIRDPKKNATPLFGHAPFSIQHRSRNDSYIAIKLIYLLKYKGKRSSGAGPVPKNPSVVVVLGS